MAGKYEPAARWGHVVAAVEDKVYVWGGLSERSFVSHDGPDKTNIILDVDILDVKVWFLAFNIFHGVFMYWQWLSTITHA